MIHVAIIGTGAISDSHIQACLALPGECQITALADLYPEKAVQKASKYGLNVPIFKDHQELLRGGSFDLACVCLPPFEHARATVDLLNGGKHVLVEKPMATSLEECDQMLRAASHTERVLSVVAQNRFRGPIARLKHVLASKLPGKILHAQVDSLWWRGQNYYDLWWRGTWEQEGGGCTINHAVHQIDLLLWMMGAPQSVRALTLNLAHENSEVEDFSVAVLGYADGSVGQITTSLVHHGEEQRLALQCEHAAVSVPWKVQAVRQKENGFPEENSELVRRLQQIYEEAPIPPVEGHQAQFANVLAAIQGREPLAIDGQDGRRTIELITAIYQSAQTGQPVSLPLDPSALFYTRERLLAHARRFHKKMRKIENFASNEITLGRNYG